MEWQTCTEPMTPAGEMQSPDHWTAREFPSVGFLFEPDPLLPMGVALGLWKPGVASLYCLCGVCLQLPSAYLTQGMAWKRGGPRL